ncbi:hypothetical protein KAT24_01840 [Candidatus Pacearchaeota archaeon]|nr:hypothetical protein [Candidatus Pacearchaeota archaeon]
MTNEKDSVRLQRVVDAMGDDYEPRKPSPFEPEMFEPDLPKISLMELKRLSKLEKYQNDK